VTDTPLEDTSRLRIAEAEVQSLIEALERARDLVQKLVAGERYNKGVETMARPLRELDSFANGRAYKGLLEDRNAILDCLSGEVDQDVADTVILTRQIEAASLQVWLDITVHIVETGEVLKTDGTRTSVAMKRLLG